MLKAINGLLERRWFPISLRIVTLIAFAGLVVIGFSSPTDDPFFVSQLSKTNLTTSFVWRLWWPLIVLSAIFLGRVWCMVCPIEMVTSLFAAIGLKMKRPRWILSGWVITIFYMIVLTIGVTVLKIDLNPKYTSFYLLAVVGIAIITGLLFEKNTFCRYVCPVGYMLGIFSKMAVWGWRVKNRSVCDGCRDKSCISGSYTYQLNYKSCGVDLVPAEIDNNNHCLLCGGCLKTCKTYKSSNNNSLRPNPALTKTGFAGDLLQLQQLKMAEWFFLFLLTGSLIFEMTHFKAVSDLAAPAMTGIISAGMGLSEGIVKEILRVIYLFIFLPSILWLLPFIMIKLSGTSLQKGVYRKYLSLSFIPFIAAFFAGISIMEIGTKFPYYKYIVNDVKGVETIKSILFMQIGIPQLPSWTDTGFIVILILLLVAGVLLSFKVIRRQLLKSDLQVSQPIMFVMPLLFIVILVTETFLFLCY